jgi:aerobic-type carbon monoxide dehydrogenase small subunit (CoxS/CutS family)
VSDRVVFTCNGEPVDIGSDPGVTLLEVLRERLEVTSVKDGCAPQGQCGCCTVLVDGEPRIACVTPAARVHGRTVTTVEGLAPALRDGLVDAFVATGGSQCGFCTPGIIVRAAWLQARGKTRPVDIERALSAHLCRCTGWQTVVEAMTAATADGPADPSRRIVRRSAHLGTEAPASPAAAARASLEGGVAQTVGVAAPLGAGGFADDTAPRDALVAVPRPPGSAAEPVAAAGLDWVVAGTLANARSRAGKVQGRRTPSAPVPPLDHPPCPAGGVRLATVWVEPAYLEPDASWCVPGGEPAPALANGGAFGGKAKSPAPEAARTLADRFGAPVRVLFAREDVVRLGPKRPPIAACARYAGGVVSIEGRVVGDAAPFLAPIAWPYRVEEKGAWSSVVVPGPATSAALRAVGLAERALLLDAAIDEAGIPRAELARDERVAAVLLDTCVATPSDALAGARVEIADDGAIMRVVVRIAAGDPLDPVVLRSYAIGAAHMALGWVLSEGLVVDRDSGDVHDLTIRSFGILRAQDTPLIDVEILDDSGAPRAQASDAVFAAVAAATWNAVTRADGARPETFPALGTRAARRLRH